MWYGTVTHYSSFWVIELWQISPVSGSWHCEKFFHFLGHSTVTIYSSFRTWCCDYVFQFLWYGTVIIYSSFYDNVLWQCVPVSVIWYCLWATFLLCSDIVGLQQDSSLWPTVVEMFRLWTMTFFLNLSDPQYSKKCSVTLKLKSSEFLLLQLYNVPWLTSVCCHRQDSSQKVRFKLSGSPSSQVLLNSV